MIFRAYPAIAGCARPKVWGQVATRTALPHGFGGTQNFMVQTMHYIRDDVSALRIAWPNYATSAETPSGGTLTLTAGINYPLGSQFTQVTFGGSPTGIETLGGDLWSDDITIPGGIPDGALIGVTFFMHNSNQIPFQSNAPNHNQPLGDRVRVGGTDMTLGGTIVDNAASTNFWPSAIWGRTSKRRAAFIADSRGVGFDDLVLDLTGDAGQIARGIGPVYAYASLAMSGETTADFIANNAKRVALAQGADTIICALGINDIRASVSAATLIANYSAIAALFPGKKFVVCTIPPDAPSSNLWIDLVGQTVPGNDPQRVSFNTSARANALGFAGMFDLAALTESSLNSGLWFVNGTPQFITIDGLHQSTNGYKRSVGFVLP